MIGARERRFRFMARAIGIIVVATGCAVLAGWHFDIAILKSIFPQFVTMKANTAVCFALSGTILFLKSSQRSSASRQRQVISSALTLTLMLIAAATLAEYVFGFNLQIDQFLYRDVRTALTPNPGRMSPATAINFLMIGTAFLLVDTETPYRLRPAQWLSAAVFVVGYIGFIGYVYDVEALYSLVMYTSVAVHTSTLMVLLAIGLLLSRPMHGFMRTVISDGANGVLLRRLVPMAIALPPLIDWLQVHSFETAGGYRIVLAAMLNVAFLFLFVWWTANSVQRAETARRDAETSARAGEERLRIALQAAAGGAWDWDLKSGVAWWSPEMYKLWNIEFGTTMRLENSLTPIALEDRERVQKTVEASIATQRPYHSEFRLSATVSEPERWIASRGRVVPDEAGNPSRLIGISLDITAQKRAAHDLLAANEALERSNVELRRFAHVASHDLQTPMRSVASFAELLRAHYASKLDARADDWLRRIEQSVHQLQRLVGDLLHYARLDSQAKTFSQVAMNTIVDRAIAMLDIAMREADAHITRDDLPNVVGSATLLQELLQNLLANALKYRSDQTPRVHVSAERVGNAWKFAVRDNGIGIESRHHERIFENFQRLHSQEKYPGTGIGLAICRRAVDTHQGKIWVESELGHGSTFFFTLPDRANEMSAHDA